MFNIDSFGNIYFTGAIAANSYPTITTTPTHVLVAGAGGIISRVAVSQLVSNTQSLSPVTSVFGRKGDIMPSRDDYNSSLIKEGSNLYFTNPRARAAISLTTTGSTGPATYNPVTGVINVPQYQSDLNGVSSFNNRTGAVVLTALDVTTALTYTPLAVETDPVWTAQKILYYTKVETESYVTTQISNLVDSAPTALNTLNELAAALGDDANFSTTVTNLIGTKEPIITPGTTSQYWRGDKTWQTLPVYTLSGLGGEPAITAGTTSQYWRGDKTWQTLPIYTLSGLGGVPTSRTLSINGTSYDLSADRSWTINSMVYPSAGIAVSTGTAWATSITNNSTNWNTAYGWGNHASAGYLTTSAAASTYLTQTNASNTYVSLTGAYSNPAFVASLAWSKITGAPSFITSYTETDTLASVTARGASTSTNITLNVVYFSDTTNGIYKSGGRLTVRSESTDDVANFANYGLYLPKTGQTAGLYVESPIEARGGLRIGSGAVNGTITVGADTGVTASRLVQRDGNGYIYANHINFNTSESENPTISSFITSNGDGWSRKSSIAHVRNQLGNYGGWITQSTGDGRYLMGTTNPGTVNNFTISIGNNGSYSYVQSHSSQPLELNPVGNAVRIAGNVVWHQGNLTNLNQLSNGPGYITGYAETDTLASVTGRGASTSTAVTFNGGINVPATIFSSFDNSWALRINRSNTSTYLGITYATGGNLEWYLGPREDATNTFRFYNFNTTLNAWSIDVSGNCTAYADIIAYSDSRVKKDISPITTALDKTLLLKGVSYKRIDIEQNVTKIGFIAQDVKEVLPEVVTYDEGADRYGVSYGNITALLVEAIKEQQLQIEDLKNYIKEINNKISKLEN